MKFAEGVFVVWSGFGRGWTKDLRRGGFTRVVGGGGGGGGHGEGKFARTTV